MSEFDRPLPGFRLADTLYGDTLQVIAKRELGDASRWVDLANINDLIPPYMTDELDQASSRVLLTGSVIVVPAQTSASETSKGVTEESLYLVDLDITSGHLESDEDGDILLISGRENLKQALVNRVIVDRGELLFHPNYGCLVRTLLGATRGATATTLAAQYVRATLRVDPRVRQVMSVIATREGDQVRVVANVLPISGQSTKLEAVI